MSFIKGSWLAARQPEGRLSLDQYLSMGRKLGGLSNVQRAATYTFFEAYEREKKQLSMFDLQDRSSYILRRLWSEGYRGDLFKSVVVDEAQDLTQEVFVTVSRPTGYDASRGTVSAFLTTMVRSRAIDRLRRRGRSALSISMIC